MAAFPLSAPCPDLTLPFEQIVPELEGTGVSGQVVPESRQGRSRAGATPGSRIRTSPVIAQGAGTGTAFGSAPGSATLLKIIRELARGRSRPG